MTTAHLIRISTLALALAIAPIHAQQRGLPPAGTTVAGPIAVSGRAIDASGKPVPGALVALLRPQVFPAGGLRQARNQHRFALVDPRLAVRTDGSGRYAISGVAPGSYAVVAIPLSQPFLADKASPIGYGVTYFPNASTAEAAGLVSVRLGTPAVADISLNSAPLHTVSGTIVSSKMTVVPGGILSMGRGDGLFGLGNGTTSIHPDGTFTVRGVPPGTYFFRYNEDSIAPVTGGRRTVLPRVSGATVVVADKDVSNVRVEPIKPTTVIGRVIIKSNAGPGAVDVTTLRVSAFPLLSDGNPGPQLPGTVGKDLAFEFQTWPALGYVRVFSSRGEIKPLAVRVNGIDVTKTGIDFLPGSTIHDVAIEITIR